jgi:protoporphyrinogen IX oxidase
MNFISYDLARGLHIISAIALIAGLVTQPRFFSYIVSSQPGGELETKMLGAAKRLRAFILTPSLILTWVFGVYLFAAYLVGDWDRPIADILAGVPLWFWAKFVLVLTLTGYHGFLAVEGRRLARGERRHSERFWRLMSEAPFVFAMAIVLLATVEP